LSFAIVKKNYLATVNSVLLYLLLLPIHPVTIHLHNTVGGRPLQLFGKVYYNRLGEPFRVNRLRYYISNIRVTDDDGVETILAGRSYLVDEAVPSSLTIKLESSISNIRSIKFIVGVDSALNVGSVQEGDLDPEKGMFWTWNSGYIYARLEGQSDSSHAPAHSFTWDIGGYRDPSNAIREVDLNLVGVNHGNVGVNGGVINIKAELLQWFDAVKPVSIAAHPVCHQPGALAMQIADNYAHMFSVE
jgi:hypothetical protein